MLKIVMMMIIVVVMMMMMMLLVFNLVWVNLKDLIGKLRIVVVRKRKVIKTKENKFKFNYITNKIKRW